MVHVGNQSVHERNKIVLVPSAAWVNVAIAETIPSLVHGLGSRAKV